MQECLSSVECFPVIPTTAPLTFWLDAGRIYPDGSFVLDVFFGNRFICSKSASAKDYGVFGRIAAMLQLKYGVKRVAGLATTPAVDECLDDGWYASAAYINAVRSMLDSRTSLEV